jgi:hypothetical protein
MLALQSLLDKSLTPSPKATLETGFSVAERASLASTIYRPMDDNKVVFSISILNMTDVTARDVRLWLRICDRCKYVNEPRESLHPEGAVATQRVWANIELANDVQWDAHKVEIEIPPPYTRATVATKYRCPDCELEKEWHNLTINLRRIGFPSFTPAPIPRTSKKRPRT